MKTFVTAAGLAVGVSAGILPRNDGCCFQLTASGDVSGTVGQLDDGQNRVGGGYGQATYCIKDGKITDGSGNGCILTAPTTQFQCDKGASPDGGFSVQNDGSLQHDGDSTFWACPADEGEYNLYTEKLDNMPKCVQVSLSTGGKCGGGAQSMTSPAAPGSTSQAGNTCPPQQTVTKTEQGKPSTVYKTETQQNTRYKPTTVYETKTETKTEQNTKVQPTTVYSTKTVEETETATKPTTVYETKTEQETVKAKPTTVYETKTQTQQETVSAKPTTVYETKTQTQQETVSAKPTTVYETKTQTQQETVKAKPTTVYETKTQTQQETVSAKPTTVYKTKTVEETETATKPMTVYQTQTQQQTVTAQQPTTVYKTKTVQQTETAQPTTVYETKTQTQQETVSAKPTTVYKTKTVEETETATKPTTVYQTKTIQQTETAKQPTTVYQTKTVEETETAKKPVTQYVTKTEEGKPSTITQYKTKVETQQAPAQTITMSEKYCPNTEGGGKPTWGGGKPTWGGGKPTWGGGKPTYGGGKPTATKPAQTGEASACPTDLSGNYEYPHLIVPVSSENPDKAYGTSYNGKMDKSTSSIFNFDIPQSYEGQTCSLVFLFPKKSDLETSDFTFNGQGSVGVEHLSSPAKQSTSWNSAPDVDSHLGDISPQPGNSYVIHTGDCAAGTTQSYELSAANGLSLEYFQDYNPSPIGLYITTC